MRGRARHALRRLDQFLKPLYLVELIDEPVQLAAEVFHVPPAVPDAAALLDTVAAFLEHVYRNAFPMGPHLSADQARNEAFAFLSQGGDRAALLSTVIAVGRNPESELPSLLWQVCESLKTRLRREHITRVMCRTLSGTAWSFKIALAQELLMRVQPYWPPHAVGMPVELWASSLDALIEEALVLDVLGTEYEAGSRQA